MLSIISDKTLFNILFITLNIVVRQLQNFFSLIHYVIVVYIFKEINKKDLI